MAYPIFFYPVWVLVWGFIFVTLRYRKSKSPQTVVVSGLFYGAASQI